MSMPALRIVAPPPPLVVQRCFDFVPITVFVVDQRRKRGRVACKASRPRPTQLALSIGESAPPPAPRDAHRPEPIRSPQLKPFIPRRFLPGARPRSLGTKRLPRVLAAEAQRDLRELAAAGFYEQTPDGDFARGPLFPRVYGDCDDMVPRVLEDVIAASGSAA